MQNLPARWIGVCFCSFDSSNSSVISRRCQELYTWTVISSQEKVSIFLCFQAAIVSLAAVFWGGALCDETKMAVRETKAAPVSYELVRSQVIRNSQSCCLLGHDTLLWTSDLQRTLLHFLQRFGVGHLITGINSLSVFVEKEHLL